MKKNLLYAFGSLVALTFLLGGLFLRGLLDFDLSGYAHRDIQFQTNQGQLSGTLILPIDVDDPPIALFVHGDGPQDRFSGDGYLIPMRLLLEAGVGVFSWDKPGVGESEGDWLRQSMSERADETVAALRAVQELENVEAANVGFLGFSQAGWVVPEAVGPGSPAAFAVLVGPAVNWEDQGAYYGRQRGAQEIPHVVMSPERMAFVERNQGSDARAALGQVDVPFLVLFGSEDLNVDPVADSKTYRALVLPRGETNQVVVIEGGTHGLLRAPFFNYQLVSQWPSWLPAAFVMAGRYAFVPGAWQQMADWMHSVVPADE